jgi:HEAT repeat protein
MLGRRAQHCCWLIVFFSTLARPANATVKMPVGMQSCTPLAVCMKLLDGAAPKADGGMGPEEIEIRRILLKFGEPAKQELLRRAAGTDPGLRNLAGAILEGWRTWTPSDVPALRAGLLREPGGWLARPLGEIGTPDAIRALVEDLPKGSENQTDYALAKLGAKAIPFLMPLLERKKTAESAQRVIGEMDSSALPFAFRWAHDATDPAKPLKIRLAALRGIAAFGSKARPASENLPPLLSNPDPTLRAEADATLKAARNPAVIHEVARACYPKADRFEPLPIDAVVCLREIAAYGQDGQSAGEELMPFVSSKNGGERADGITTLAAIGYKSALPQIKEALSSPDWRVTYAAVRAIGWLGDKEALPDLEKVSANHWLPEVREEAARAIAALRSPKGRLDETWKFFPLDENAGEAFEVDSEILRKEVSCSSQRWIWNGTTFTLARALQGNEPRRDISLAFSGGKLTGRDNGEFGGTLTWKGADRNVKPTVIFKDDVTGMAKDRDGAMVLFGLSHMGFDYGYVLRADRSSDNKWILSEVARLPGNGEALTTIAPGIFAALSRNRVVVFTPAAILGLATCDAR